MTSARIRWSHTLVLRQQVLGWTADPVPGDESAGTVHLAVLDAQHAPLAVVSACPHPCPQRPGTAATYLWAMAVAEADWSVAAGRTVLWADARSAAVGFYLACGATIIGDAYRDPVTGLADRRIVFDLGPTERGPVSESRPDAG